MLRRLRGAIESSCRCLRPREETLERKYNIPEDGLLGRGTFAKVYKGTHRRTGKQVAVKRIDKASSRRDLLNTEIWILQNFGNHPNIVNFYDMYETEAEVQLVIELMPGGELFDMLDENGPYGEAEAAKHLKAISSGLNYLHSGNVVHRDLKPENLLLTSKGPEGVLKISDFGLAKVLIDEELMRVACGTWIYCAPEVLLLKQKRQGDYDSKCDIFSVGCILFMIMGGYHPFDFDGNDDEELMQECILSDTWDFDDPAWEKVSAQAKDLIEQMLKWDPKERLTAAELAAHPWTKGLVEYGSLSTNIDKDLKRTRASLRTNKVEGAQHMQKAPQRFEPVAEIDGFAEAPQAPLGMSPFKIEIRPPSQHPTGWPKPKRGGAEGPHAGRAGGGTGGSTVEEVSPLEPDGGTGGALLLPKPRRRKTNSAMSAISTRSMLSRRGAAPLLGGEDMQASDSLESMYSKGQNRGFLGFGKKRGGEEGGFLKQRQLSPVKSAMTMRGSIDEDAVETPKEAQSGPTTPSSVAAPLPEGTTGVAAFPPGTAAGAKVAATKSPATGPLESGGGTGSATGSPPFANRRSEEEALLHAEEVVRKQSTSNTLVSQGKKQTPNKATPKATPPKPPASAARKVASAKQPANGRAGGHLAATTHAPVAAPHQVHGDGQPLLDAFEEEASASLRRQETFSSQQTPATPGRSTTPKPKANKKSKTYLRDNSTSTKSTPTERSRRSTKNTAASTVKSAG